MCASKDGPQSLQTFFDANVHMFDSVPLFLCGDVQDYVGELACVLIARD